MLCQLFHFTYCTLKVGFQLCITAILLIDLLLNVFNLLLEFNF